MKFWGKNGMWEAANRVFDERYLKIIQRIQSHYVKFVDMYYIQVVFKLNHLLSMNAMLFNNRDIGVCR